MSKSNDDLSTSDYRDTVMKNLKERQRSLQPARLRTTRFRQVMWRLQQFGRMDVQYQKQVLAMDRFIHEKWMGMNATESEANAEETTRERFKQAKAAKSRDPRIRPKPESEEIATRYNDLRAQLAAQLAHHTRRPRRETDVPPSTASYEGKSEAITLLTGPPMQMKPVSCANDILRWLGNLCDIVGKEADINPNINSLYAWTLKPKGKGISAAGRLDGGFNGVIVIYRGRFCVKNVIVKNGDELQEESLDQLVSKMLSLIRAGDVLKFTGKKFSLPRLLLAFEECNSCFRQQKPDQQIIALPGGDSSLEMWEMTFVAAKEKEPIRLLCKSEYLTSWQTSNSSGNSDDEGPSTSRLAAGEEEVSSSATRLRQNARKSTAVHDDLYRSGSGSAGYRNTQAESATSSFSGRQEFDRLVEIQERVNRMQEINMDFPSMSGGLPCSGTIGSYPDDLFDDEHFPSMYEDNKDPLDYLEAMASLSGRRLELTANDLLHLESRPQEEAERTRQHNSSSLSPSRDLSLSPPDASTSQPLTNLNPAALASLKQLAFGDLTGPLEAIEAGKKFFPEASTSILLQSLMDSGQLSPSTTSGKTALDSLTNYLAAHQSTRASTASASDQLLPVASSTSTAPSLSSPALGQLPQPSRSLPQQPKGGKSSFTGGFFNNHSSSSKQLPEKAGKNVTIQSTHKKETLEVAKGRGAFSPPKLRGIGTGDVTSHPIEELQAKDMARRGGVFSPPMPKAGEERKETSRPTELSNAVEAAREADVSTSSAGTAPEGKVGKAARRSHLKVISASDDSD